MSLPTALPGVNAVLGAQSQGALLLRDFARGRGRQPWAPGAVGRSRDDSGVHDSCHRSRDTPMKVVLAPGARFLVWSPSVWTTFKFQRSYRTQPCTTFIRADRPEQSVPYADCSCPAIRRFT